MKGKLIGGALLVAVCLGLLVAKGVSQPPPRNDKQGTIQPIPQAPQAGTPARLVPGSTELPAPTPTVEPPKPPADSTSLAGSTEPNSASIPTTTYSASNPVPPSPTVSTQNSPATQERTFEQILSELRRNRDAQKRLKEQEQNLVAALRRKVDEKHKDWQNAEAMLREVEGKPARAATTSVETEKAIPLANRLPGKPARTHGKQPGQTIEPPQQR